MKDHLVFFFSLSFIWEEIQRSEKKKNVVEVKARLNCPEASADLQTGKGGFGAESC